MISVSAQGAFLVDGRKIVQDDENASAKLASLGKTGVDREQAKKGTIAYQIIRRHNPLGNPCNLRIRFDSLTSHDLTYVGIIQTAKASGMEKFPMPVVMTNCHNSLCAVGGTINEDDHLFAYSAAKKYGGIFVPPNLAVIHAYNREMMAKCGNMILGSDSHTRYGPLGTMGVGEGGGELVKQLLNDTYDLSMPKVVAVYLTGKPRNGVGPQDVALSIIGKVYQSGYVKNKVMEFVGDGVSSLNVDFRNGIDVMTTEAACWSSIWETDEQVEEYYEIHGRKKDYRRLQPGDVTYYDGVIQVDLSSIEPSIALPFHPSNVYPIAEFKANAMEILHDVSEDAKRRFTGASLNFDLSDKVKDGEIHVDQGIVAGCAGGTYDNIVDTADILSGKSIGNGPFKMSVYPASQPEYLELVKNGTVAELMQAGIVFRNCFCGPCFGAGDTPANHEFSIRHTTRNFPNREGSKPTEGQLSFVALVDARSIAATAVMGGKLTAATDLDISFSKPDYHFDETIYRSRVFNGFGHAQTKTPLQLGPNIRDWPQMPKMTEHLLLKVVSYITDPVTTTDELIPSGETSSFRSNPQRISEYTLYKRDPAYVGKAKEVRELESLRERGDRKLLESPEILETYKEIKNIEGFQNLNECEIGIGSTIFANKPGDGSAREQAASCQKVLGGWANFAREYATKRYRSNLINWGIVPFLVDGDPIFREGDYLFVPHLRQAILQGEKFIHVYLLGEKVREFKASIGQLTDEEKTILTEGCLINYNRSREN